jgi:hypothetical protein
MAEAAKRGGNRYTAVTLHCAFPIAWLAHAEPDAIEAELDAALRSWSSVDGGYQLQHLLGLASRIDLALYRGDPEHATPHVASELKPIRRSLVDRPPLQGMLLQFALIRHAVGCASHAPARSARRREALAQARAHVRGLRGKLPVIGLCAQISAGLIAEATGDMDEAVRCYREALSGLERTDIHLFAHAVRYRVGRLVGGDEGAALCAGVHAWLEREGVREPDRMLHMMLPAPRKD